MITWTDLEMMGVCGMKYEIDIMTIIDTPSLIFNMKERCHSKLLLFDGVQYVDVLLTEDEDYLNHAVSMFISQNDIKNSPKEDTWYFKSDNTNKALNLLRILKETSPKSTNFINNIAHYYEGIMSLLIGASLKGDGFINKKYFPDKITLEQAFLTGLGVFDAVNLGLTIRHQDVLSLLDTNDNELKELAKIGELVEAYCLEPFSRPYLYQFMKNDYDFDIANIESCERKIDTEKFLEWAVDKKFIKEITTNEEPTERDKRVAIVKGVLTPYLNKRTRPISVHALSKDTDFHTLLAQASLMIIQNDEDTPKQNPDDCFMPTLLEVYLTEIVTSLEWKDQPTKIKDRLAYKPKNKRKAKK